MKTKNDFTTNSSSASFIISTDDITARQREQIYNHAELAGNDAWSISETFYFIKGYTYMDNFDMLDYLQKIGVNLSKVKYERE